MSGCSTRSASRIPGATSSSPQTSRSCASSVYLSGYPSAASPRTSTPSDARHVFVLVAAASQAVAVGTVLFRDPDAPARVRGELDAELASLGFATADDARGVAHDGGVGALVSKV